MTEPCKRGEIATDPLERTYEQGRRAGLATAASIDRAVCRRGIRVVGSARSTT
ncbi:MAG: hypothetical protein HY718_13320 [Planctomycetes bacterium]|nr:hypothetical protein [Planctomycetota bacterium]